MLVKPAARATLQAIADVTDPTVINNILTLIKTGRAPTARSDSQTDNGPSSKRYASREARCLSPEGTWCHH